MFPKSSEAWCSRMKLCKNTFRRIFIKSLKKQLKLEQTFQSERKKYITKYSELSDLLKKQASQSISVESLKIIYDSTIEFLRDYSYYIIQYSFIQKNGFKNKIGLKVLRRDVYEVLKFYLSLYSIFKKISDAKMAFPFAYSHVMPLYLFINQGATGKIKNHIMHRWVLKVKKAGKK